MLGQKKDKQLKWLTKMMKMKMRMKEGMIKCAMTTLGEWRSSRTQDTAPKDSSSSQWLFLMDTEYMICYIWLLYKAYYIMDTEYMLYVIFSYYIRLII